MSKNEIIPHKETQGDKNCSFFLLNYHFTLLYCRTYIYID